MGKNPILFAIALLVYSGCTSTKENQSTPTETATRPNIVLIMADDLGYGELGCYGQTKIETPNIDQLRSEGMLFSKHYSGSAVCAPSRCILLTGKHSGHAYVRGNDEWKDRGEVWNYRAMFENPELEGQRPMPASEVTVAEELQASGYKTAIVGKWGLGAPHTESIPTKRGFDFFCGYNCQRQAHTYYPLHLYRNEERLLLRNDTIEPHKKLPEGTNFDDPSVYAPFNLEDYAPDVMYRELEGFVDRSGDDPFFLYWASPIPHVALQAPQRWVDHYKAKFGPEEPYEGNKGYYAHQHPRAAYAAMVSYLDENIGKLVSQLKSQGKYENTVFMFTSDNGPSYAGGADSHWFDSAGPFSEDRHWIKGSLREGGIRIPLIVSWPGKIKAGSESGLLSAHWDIYPTICDMAGIAKGDQLDGISMVSTLTGQGEQVEHPFLYWEFPESGGQRAIRTPQWKAINQKIKDGNTAFQLFDMTQDSTEQVDLADKHPDIIEEMESIFRNERTIPAIDRWKLKPLGD